MIISLLAKRVTECTKRREVPLPVTGLPVASATYVAYGCSTVTGECNAYEAIWNNRPAMAIIAYPNGMIRLLVNIVPLPFA
jgi:hypothetical protein